MMVSKKSVCSFSCSCAEPAEVSSCFVAAHAPHSLRQESQVRGRDSVVDQMEYYPMSSKTNHVDVRHFYFPPCRPHIGTQSMTLFVFLEFQQWRRERISREVTASLGSRKCNCFIIIVVLLICVYHQSINFGRRWGLGCTYHNKKPVKCWGWIRLGPEIGLFVLAVLLRLNSHSILFNHLKHIVQPLFYWIHKVVQHSHFQNISSPPKKLNPLAVTP